VPYGIYAKKALKGADPALFRRDLILTRERSGG
jgi:hypothetical protein